MAHLVIALFVFATIAFVLASATMNAAALATFGRTALEVWLLVTVSLAADAAKAVLPVALARAVVVRAWMHGLLAALLLAAVIALSVFSGMTFVALTKSRSAAVHDAHLERAAAVRADLARVEKRMAGLGEVRSAAVVGEELKGHVADRRWSASKECTDLPTGATALRQFCAGVFKARGDLAAAQERDRLQAEQRRLRDRLGELQDKGVADVDAGPRQLGGVLGLDTAFVRTVMSLELALVLELGSVVLVLLLSGPTIDGWRAAQQRTAGPAAELPPQVDRQFWKERGTGVLVRKGNGHEQA